MALLLLLLLKFETPFLLTVWQQTPCKARIWVVAGFCPQFPDTKDLLVDHDCVCSWWWSLIRVHQDPVVTPPKYGRRHEQMTEETLLQPSCCANA